MSSNSTPYASAPQRPRRSPHRTPKHSLDINNDNEDYVVISNNPFFDMPDSRPSYGGDSEHHSDMGDSNMSHDPLLAPMEPSPRYEKAADADRRLLTVNKLDPVQRAALVRQSRKIHKILGETPQIAEMSQPLPPRPAGNRLQRRGTLAGSDIRLDRSAAMAALESPSLEPPPGSNWGKAMSSLVATSPGLGTNANAPLLKLNVVPSPGDGLQPIRQRRLSDSSVASSSMNSILSLRRGSNATAVSPPPDSTEHNDGNRSQRNAPKATRSNSSGIYIPASPTSPPPANLATLQRQQTRARMAKLQQIMGEPVPSELVIGTPQNQRRRRLSMESPTSTASPVQALKHKRSRSMWKKDPKEDVAFDSAPETSRASKNHGRSKSRDMPPIEDLLLKQLQTPMSEKQKALNVKRALKMASVFGVPPPQTLYQDKMPIQPNPSFHSLSRQSLASLAYMLDHDRDSLYDMLANAEDSGSDSDQEPVDWPYERKPRSDSLPESQAAKGSAKYTIAGRYPDMAPPTPPFRGSFDQNDGVIDLSPQTKSKSTRPPPLTIYSTSTSTSSSTGKPSSGKVSKPPSTPGVRSPPGDAHFSARRRRANKLSRFFGVGYNDLFNFMVYGGANVDGQSASLAPPVPQLPSSSSPVTPKASPSNINRNNLTVPGSTAATGGGLTRSGTVLVQTDSGKATVLRTSTNLAADVDADDLQDVMSRLRNLRA